MKKRTIYLFLLILIVLVGFNSCTINKRVYQPGYHVVWNKIKKETKPQLINEVQESNNIDSNHKIVVDNQDVIIEEQNFANSTKSIQQTIIIQDFEPAYASNDENANNIEIINVSKQKNIFTKKVVSEIYESAIKKKPKKSTDTTEDEREIHVGAIVGLGLTMLSVPLSYLGTGLSFLGVLGALFVIGGLIVSICALIQIIKNPEMYRGKGLAIAGIIVNPITLSVLALAAYIIISMYI